MKTIFNSQLFNFILKGQFIMAMILLLAATSCRKDDDNPEPVVPVYQLENPLVAYHTAAGFTTTNNFINAGSYEFGLVFSPNVKGNIKGITAMLPDVNANLKVTIWDFDTKTVLRTEMVNVASANTAVTKEISDLPLEKDKKYVITMNSNDWYQRRKADNSNATYPITAGNIKIHDYRWVGGATQTFPTNISLNYNGGDLSFNFQQTP